MKSRFLLFTGATILLVCLFVAPDWLYSAGAFLRDAARLMVLGK